MLSLLLLAMLPEVVGIGLRPASIRMNLVPGFERTFEFAVTNTMNIPIKASITPYYNTEALEGTLSVSEKEILLGPFERGTFYVTIKIPEDISAPGVSRMGVRANEERADTGAGGVNLRAGVATIIDLRGLYPGKYIDARLTAEAKGEGEPVLFTLSLVNLGEELITKAVTKFEVYDVLDNSLITLLESNTIENIQSWHGDTMTAKLEGSNVQRGQYRVVATVFYDGETKVLEQMFRVGEYAFEILSFTHEGTILEIIPFEIMVESKWNQDFQDIYAEVAIKAGRDTIKEFKTPLTNLRSFEKKSLIGYLDAKSGISIGTYTAEVKVFYAEGVVATQGEFYLYDEQGRLRGDERTGGFGMQERPKKPFFTTTNILIIVIIVLVMVNIIWFIYMRRKRYEVI